jgi:hypothetical protein
MPYSMASTWPTKRVAGHDRVAPVLLEQHQPGPFGLWNGLDRELGNPGQGIAELHLPTRHPRQRSQAQPRVVVLTCRLGANAALNRGTCTAPTPPGRPSAPAGPAGPAGAPGVSSFMIDPRVWSSAKRLTGDIAPGRIRRRPHVRSIERFSARGRQLRRAPPVPPANWTGRSWSVVVETLSRVQSSTARRMKRLL